MAIDLKVLVFPCGTEIGLEIQRALDSARGIVLFGGSSVGDHGEFAYKNYIPDIPYVSDDRFLAELNGIIKERGIDYVIPAHDAVILKLAEAAESGRLSCRLLTAPYSTCRICRSKNETHSTFTGLLPVPRRYSSLEDVREWPVFLKPDLGCGSRGVFLCSSRAEASRQLEKCGDLLIFEYLPGREYTVDCFTDRHGKLVFCGGRERARILNGISVRTIPVDSPALRKAAEIINSKLDFRGVWFFQMKEDKSGRPMLLEIAPRVAGAMALYRNLGVNFALMSLYDAEGHDVDVIRNEFPLIFDRALGGRFKAVLDYSRVYVDWDDCVVRGDSLNLPMVAFLYQCVDSGVELILLTRHAGDLRAALRRHRLEQVFSSVVHIKDGSPKSSFVKAPTSIFIDDSFAERKEVREKTGIPVFAPDAVESLLHL